MQARREGGVRRVSYPGPRDVWGPAVGQKSKVRQNVPFWKEKFKNFLPRGAPWECFGAPRERFPGPRCGSRRACTDAVARHVSFTRITCYINIMTTATKMTMTVSRDRPMTIILVVYDVLSFLDASGRGHWSVGHQSRPSRNVSNISSTPHILFIHGSLHRPLYSSGISDGIRSDGCKFSIEEIGGSRILLLDFPEVENPKFCTFVQKNSGKSSVGQFFDSTKFR